MQPRGLRAPNLRPFLDPRSSSPQSLERCCAFQRTDCGLRNIAALPGVGQIADCTLGTIGQSAAQWRNAGSNGDGRIKRGGS
eukprot:14678754-Alexandrium_andersonii.AAC.1